MSNIQAGLDDKLLQAALSALRQHLKLDVGFISEFAGGRRIFRCVDTSLLDSPVKVGASDPLDESYCQRVVDGRLPELLTNAQLHPEALQLAATTALPVGAHLSVPVRLSDGSVYGTFCCFSSSPNAALGPSEVAVMRIFAELAAIQIERSIKKRKALEEASRRIQTILKQGGLTSVYQPILDCEADRIIGFEALSRFPATPKQTPDIWFADAAVAGLGTELELHAIENALKALDRLPAGVYVSVNASQRTITDARLAAMLSSYPANRIVVEITEHEVVSEYAQLLSAFKPLRANGIRLAVDDAGAGYASFRHILRLQPHYIKLDISLTRGITSDKGQFALAAALIRFAQETDAIVVAEGVETAEELAALKSLGVRKAQGYYFGKPVVLDEALAKLRGA
jgi:EAL domain-containing protein (putative c-di-GMP-specific phosphodiesterase class I)